MMTNLFSKTVYIDLYTCDKLTYEVASSMKASLERPKWWLNLPKSKFCYDEMRPDTTMKSCVGINLLFKHRYPLVSPCDLYLNSYEETLNYFSQNPNSLNITTHHPDQHGNSFGNNTNVKMNLKWVVKTSEPVEILLTNSIADTPDLTNTLSLLNGVLPSDCNSELNLNFFMTKSNNGVKAHIPAFSVLANLIPITNKKVVYRHYLIKEKEFNNLIKEESCFTTNTYYRAKKIRSKCPFLDS